MKALRRAFSLEEQSDGLAHQEIEYVFYGRLTDLSELHKASRFEYQEQWEVKIPQTEQNITSARMRVRETITSISSQPTFVHTTKTQSEDQAHPNEVSIPTTEAHFHQYQLISNNGMIKDRYFFPVVGEGTNEELVWELDVYYIKGSDPFSNNYTQWCRLELEVKNPNTPIPPLPIQLEELISPTKDGYTEEENKKISYLFEHEFLTSNKHK